MSYRTFFRLCGALALVCLGLTAVEAKIVTQVVTYRQDRTVMRGFLAYDDGLKAKRPGVLVVHEWWGLNGFARERAVKLAGLGYVALAADMYGDGATTRDREEAGKLAGALRGNPDLLRARAQAAFKVLATDPRVDPKRLAAIGFCFGGTTVLELAYSGADLAGVVSFHGGLPRPQPGDLKRFKAKILVLHGADDPHVPAADITAFEQAMRQAGADWQMVFFGGAVHSFTNPAAGHNPAAGAAYDARAARRSWRCMQEFFREIWRVKGQD
ncbi:MAG: dienelactone hydrolase family protein [Desulfobacterales bacterium]|nr:dienelactone hydrolase family protein [Pseudomonadota bacterium]MBU4354392.1 dienelactone hydrolase family protein [Pseudomonadota bacterium]MCG2770728.1 dienelactone hydrolase family protein [Desulfobacterales bacterium]